MSGIVLGVTMLVFSTGVSPAVETSRATVVPAAFTFHVPDDAATSRNLLHRLLNEPSRPVWRRGSLQPAQATTAKRFTKADRIIAVVAGTCVGWMAGGAIGYAATSKPDDDVSGLRGVVIGAPIGAVVGAVVGYRLTK
jgi:hypothetical protein